MGTFLELVTPDLLSESCIHCGVVAVPTNWTLDRFGQLAMGAGFALAVRNMVPELPAMWGKVVATSRHPFVWCGPQFFRVPGGMVQFCMFPIKTIWKAASYPPLIAQSARGLMRMLDDSTWGTELGTGQVFLPAPGTGLGQLSWDTVRAILLPILDERVTVVRQRITKKAGAAE